jgi:hypothetical protein
VLDSNARVITYYLQSRIKNFLVRNRDLVNVLEFDSVQVNKSFRIRVRADSGLVPQNDDYIRILKSDGFWLLQEKGDGLVQVTFQVHTEPRGTIPSWLVNSFIVDAPFKDLVNLRERLKMEKYRKAGIRRD